MTAGLAFAVVLARGSILKSIAMVLLGLLLSTVGNDLETGEERMTFGCRLLSDGLDFAVLAMGLFGFAEVMRNLDSGPRTRDVVPAPSAGCSLTWPTFGSRPLPDPAGDFPWAGLGILPGNGAVLGPFASYALEKKLAKDPPLRPRRHRGRGRARVGQQRRRADLLHPAPHPRHPAERGDGADGRAR